jgi:hypothetical protein
MFDDESSKSFTFKDFLLLVCTTASGMYTLSFHMIVNIIQSNRPKRYDSTNIVDIGIL